MVGEGEKMNVYIRHSKIGYQTKPTAEDMKRISWEIQNQNCKKVSYEELAKLLENGHSVSLAKYKDNCRSIAKANAEYSECIAIDVDSKDYPIALEDMKELILSKFDILPIIEYNTFSDTNNTRFRLIYRLSDKIDAETFERLYKAFTWKIKQLDKATTDISRIWAGTDKLVTYNKYDKPVTFPLMVKLINAYDDMIKRKEKKRRKTLVAGKSNELFINDKYIKPGYKRDVMELIVKNTDLTEYIRSKFGGDFREKSGNIVGCCSLHGGDNRGALVISGDIFTCFTHCGTGNIFTVAKKYYNVSNFSELAFRIAEEHGITIPDDFIVRLNK